MGSGRLWLGCFVKQREDNCNEGSGQNEVVRVSERKKKNRTRMNAARIFKWKRDPQERELVIPSEN